MIVASLLGCKGASIVSEFEYTSHASGELPSQHPRAVHLEGPWAVGSTSLAGTRLSCTMTVQLLSNESSPFLLLDFHFCPCEETELRSTRPAPGCGGQLGRFGIEIRVESLEMAVGSQAK